MPLGLGEAPVLLVLHYIIIVNYYISYCYLGRGQSKEVTFSLVCNLAAGQRSRRFALLRETGGRKEIHRHADIQAVWPVDNVV